MHALSDKELVILAIKGDIHAFEQLLFRYEKQIFVYLLRFVNQKENAEDVTQETFIKVYRSLKTFDSEYKFKTWLYTVATNTAYDWLRKAKKSQELFIIDDPDSEFETIDECTAYKDIEIKENKELVDNAINKIKPTYQTVILLFYRDELGYEEIAEVLKMPINTVKTHL
ncbi:MAG: sigma-70 family RNA polymerase sigma factor, partial [Candidatus Magasanikbacteria bacterium]|nr:sigma-70 family RNA polymerase sigma factor [Candidatus Magasanikbacteria bacterium]